MNSLINDLTLLQIQGIKQKALQLQNFEELYLLIYEIINLPSFTDSRQNSLRNQVQTFVILGYYKQYTTFKIKKASGKYRLIHVPELKLKQVQRLINIILQTLSATHLSAFGFKPLSSIVGNATIHTNCNYVYNIDLKDFFTNITKEQVTNALQGPHCGLNFNISNHIAELACISLVFDNTIEGKKTVVEKCVLPQGAPTSPVLSNIVCYPLDEALKALADRYKLRYSRYADDITFSSNKNCYQEGSRFIISLNAVILNFGFELNHSKTRLQQRHSRQVVTGLTVNKKINVDRAFLKSLRMYIHYWEKYGYQKAEALLNKDLLAVKLGRYSNLYQVVRGKLDFLKTVIGSENKTYLNLKGRWKCLTDQHSNETSLRSEYFEAHRPKDVAMFLRLFQDSSGLKYLTHDYDIPGKDYQYEQIMELANKDFNNAYRKFAITRNLYARIKQFAFSKRPDWWRWINGQRSTSNAGWCTSDTKQWVAKNPGIHPIRSKRFRDDLINPFKESIQVRTPNLKMLIENAFKEKFQQDYGNLKITMENLESAEFYTDVDTVMGGVRHLLDGIVERQDISNDISVSFRRETVGEDRLKVIEITHINSICHKEAIVDELKSGNLKEAEKAFRGLCNWAITSKFKDGYYKLYVLNDSADQPEKEIVNSAIVNGFTHTLYFY